MASCKPLPSAFASLLKFDPALLVPDVFADLVWPVTPSDVDNVVPALCCEVFNGNAESVRYLVAHHN